jgi:hypothetical protein
MFLTRCLSALVLVVFPALVWAQPIGVGCSRPVVSPDAVINVVVLPYSQPASFGRSPIGEQLAGLIELETMLTLAKLGSVGTVHLFHDAPGACVPDLVYDKLMGRRPGAQRPLIPGRGFILIWGRIFQSGPDLFIQSFIRFGRRQADEAVAVEVRGQRLTGRLSTQVFACAPRKVSVADLTTVQQQIAAASIIRVAPSPSAPPAPQPPVPMPSLITEVKGDWMQVQFMNPNAPRQRTQFNGWVQARGTESLRRQMPEMYFVEGVAQYLAVRVPGSRVVADTTLQNADAAIARYLEAWGENAVLGSDAAAGGTPLAVAVPRQLRAFISLIRRRPTDDAPLAEARAQFERAASLVPQSSHARNLVILTRIAQTYLNPSADQPPRQFVDDVRGILGSDPGNRTILENLRAIYDLVLASVPNAPASWGLTPADREQLTKQRESLEGLLKRS